LFGAAAIRRSIPAQANSYRLPHRPFSSLRGGLPPKQSRANAVGWIASPPVRNDGRRLPKTSGRGDVPLAIVKRDEFEQCATLDPKFPGVFHFPAID
jgi:hypothetical protein